MNLYVSPKFIFHSPVFSKQLSVQIVVKMQTRNKKNTFSMDKKEIFFFLLVLFSNNAQSLRGEQKYYI